MMVGFCAFSGGLRGLSWFRQSGVVSSRLVVEPVETHQRVTRTVRRFEVNKDKT